MLLTEIKREVLLSPSETSSDVFTLANDADSVLGYSKLKEALEDNPEQPRLSAVLATLGIDVLSKPDVATYMRERAVERSQELFASWSVGDFNPERSWNRFEGAYWESTPIEKYKEAIPEFVVNKAVQIKRALPDVQIYITHLTEARDPFLKVTYGEVSEWDPEKGETYFVEVWAEPKFEGRLR